MQKITTIILGLSGLIIAASPVVAQDEASESMGKSMMEAACRDQDFGSFFEGFSRATSAERQAYLAPTIKVVKSGKTNMIPRANYTGYDITLVDYSYATASSFALFDADKRRDFDKITHNADKLADGSYRVDWSRGKYAVSGDGEEESLVRRFGPAQSYGFQKTDSCWQLGEDRTGPARR